MLGTLTTANLVLAGRFELPTFRFGDGRANPLRYASKTGAPPKN